MSASFSSFVTECKRVLVITRKPSKQEFKDLVKVCGIGILAIGFLGFLLATIKTLIFG